jgi:hypothetical protein
MPPPPVPPAIPDDPQPYWDRWDPRTVDARRQEGAYAFEEHQGFEPSSLEYEKTSGGWLRTTMPEGLPMSELHDLYVAGSRGAEMRLMKMTPGRTTRRGRRGFVDSTPGHQAVGEDWDYGDEAMET